MAPGQPAALGIIACPGGQKFTEEMFPHLKKLYRKRYDQFADMLLQRYGMSKEEAVRTINLTNDLQSRMPNNSTPAEKYNIPSFKIPVKYTRFPNGEFKAEILHSIRGAHVYIVQDVENHYPLKFHNSPGSYVLSVNDHVFCLLVTIDAARHAGAESITIVLPAYPYARQHKKNGREALTASLFGRMVEQMGVERIITLDIHSKEIENSFQRLRLENLHASYQILRKLMTIIDVRSSDLVVVSPDTGAVDRNKFYAENLGKPLALLYKERDYSKVTQNALHNNITNMRLLGSVEGKTVFMADDLIGTGGTVIKAMEYLKELGAKRIVCAISLPLFTGDAINHFDAAHERGLFEAIIGTNAVYHGEDLLSKGWYVNASISNLFARIIARLHHGRSLSSLLDNREIIRRLLSPQIVSSTKQE
ncbi:MAG TPA: ribose-phosphate diphosphokinase [Spirochaetia bacterium]|nr:ribose-phosphate diphosphokinase [Spirochaetia bacterium]